MFDFPVNTKAMKQQEWFSRALNGRDCRSCRKRGDTPRFVSHASTKRGRANKCLSCKNYQERNSLAKPVRRAKYRALSKARWHPTTKKVEVARYYKRSNQLTASTGIKHHVDHIIPYDKGGWHHESNLQILTEHENLAKGGKLSSIKGERFENNIWTRSW